MQEAVPVGMGAMAAIVGADSVVLQACEEAAQGEIVSPANINCPGQVVMPGMRRPSLALRAGQGPRRTPGDSLR